MITDKSYEISVNVRAPGGWHPFGYFQVGREKEQAVATFESLEGFPGEDVGTLRMELFEHEGGEVVLIAYKGCTLEEFAANTRIIARDAFKYVSLE